MPAKRNIIDGKTAEGMLLCGPLLEMKQIFSV